MAESYYKIAIREEARHYWRRRGDGDLSAPFRGFLILYAPGQELDADDAKAYLLAELARAKPKEVTELIDFNVTLVRKPYPRPKELGNFFHFDLEALAKIVAA